ncbi:hypothetical protein SEA_AOKA_48 [Arthrobacter phage Aoka]|nr:hypothetical protein SEA_AOKA_48 [Arthrobacter phage Aoka]
MNPDDLVRVLLLCGLYAIPGLAYGLGSWIILRRRRRPRPDEVDAVAQAIARCYGHGPLAAMDQTYRDEFRRDARAAIAAMRRRA